MAHTFHASILGGRGKYPVSFKMASNSRQIFLKPCANPVTKEKLKSNKFQFYSQQNIMEKIMQPIFKSHDKKVRDLVKENSGQAQRGITWHGTADQKRHG